MRIVDTHCHVAQNWYEPAETLLHQMQRAGVDHALLIQLLGRFDNDYLFECRQQHPQRFSVVVGVDVTSADAGEQLRRAAEAGAVGIRLRPTARSPGDDPLLIWRLAEAYQIAVSCVGNATTFATAEFRELIAALPRLSIVLEHLGSSSEADKTDADRALRAKVFELAQFPNVFLKLPGLGELAPRMAALPATGSPLESSAKALLELALNSFGAERLMWGSDFPVVASREGYANALAWPKDIVVTLAPAQQAQIFGDNARRIFKLKD